MSSEALDKTVIADNWHIFPKKLSALFSPLFKSSQQNYTPVVHCSSPPNPLPPDPLVLIGLMVNQCQEVEQAKTMNGNK